MTEPPLPEESIFAQAIEITSAAERAAFLDRACGHDQALRTEVEALLRPRNGPAICSTCPTIGPAILPSPRDTKAAVRSSARTSCSSRSAKAAWAPCCMAEQTHPSAGPVAVKVIKPGHRTTRQVLARFEAERQVLAMMDHPNIAKCSTPAPPVGRPYFVMELVNGIPITEYCDENRLGVRERLGCCSCTSAEPVQHAHQKGIIHRDSSRRTCWWPLTTASRWPG